MKKHGKIAVLTSGGDAPGMNAALRALVRTAAFQGREVVGIQNGYEGLIHGQALPLSVRSVGNIIQRGGTILGSSRSKRFQTREGRAQAYEFLKYLGVESLITLGGDGTLTGAGILAREWPLRVIGIPVTIDNDLYGTDYAIGFQTAIESAVSSIDKIRDTADSHGRVFVVEVMGRNTGHLAIETALAVGAEFVVIPEAPFSMKKLIAKIRAGIHRGKSGSIVVVAEKDRPGFSLTIADAIRKHISRDVRAAVLGHLQRGGSPLAADRNLASHLGAAAAELALSGRSKIMVGMVNSKVSHLSFKQILGRRRHADPKKLELVDRLSI